MPDTNISAPPAISHQLSTALFIPERYGRVEKQPQTSNIKPQTSGLPQVILVKDAHCNYEAQTNISKILDILIRDHKIDLVAVEGASGFVNPQILLESNPDKELVKKTTDKFLRSGLLTASETLSANRGREPGFTIWGVEDFKLYLRDYQAFRDTIDKNNTAKHFTEIISTALKQLKKKIYTDKALDFDNTADNYNSNKLPLTQFIKIIYAGYGIPKEHQNLKLVLKSINLEKQINFKTLENERALLIGELERILPKEDTQFLIKQSLLFKLGKISALDYYSYLNKYIFAVNHRPSIINLFDYSHLLKLQSKMDENELFSELENLTENIYNKLCGDNISGNLHKLDKDIKILGKILSLEATRENLIYFKENKESFAPEKLSEFIKIQAPLNNIILPPELNNPAFMENVSKAIAPAEEFYELAIERDTALVENLLKEIDKNKKDKAILVCGGFHAEGINKILRDKAVETITITPSITKIQDDSREIYLKRIMDGKIDPKKMLQKYGLENFGPITATSKEGVNIGLPEPIFRALQGAGEDITPGQIKGLRHAYADGNELFKEWLRELVDAYNRRPGNKMPINLDGVPASKHSLFGNFCNITQQNLLRRLHPYLADSPETENFRRTIPTLLQIKAGIRKNEPLDKLRSRAYPYNCVKRSAKAEDYLKVNGFANRIQKIKITFSKKKSPSIIQHSFVIATINDKEFIIDIAADQFEPIAGEPDKFQDLGVVIIPVDIVDANPERFWMYDLSEETETPSPEKLTTPAALKAPGNAGLNEDTGVKKYIEKTIEGTRQREEIHSNANFHILDLSERQLGIPRKEGAASPQDLIYAYGKNIDGKLHIYVTAAFWDILRKNELMLAFLIDHEYEENILGKTHAQASLRAWEFVDEFGMNPFYKFFIDQLYEAEEIDYLIKLTEEHPNDPEGTFRDYAISTLAIKLPQKLQITLSEKLTAGEFRKAQEIISKLRKIHDVLDALTTNSKMASALVFEKLENILWDMLRKGNTENSVNLMCITLPMAPLNANYETANKVKALFYKKVKEYTAGKRIDKTKEDKDTRLAYEELSGQDYGFAQTRLFVIGLTEADFPEIQNRFAAALTESGITGREEDLPGKYPIHAGHIRISLNGRTDIISNFAGITTLQGRISSEQSPAEKERIEIEKKRISDSITNELERIIVDSIKETTGRAEVAEKILERPVLGQKDEELLTRHRDAITNSRRKFVPENEYETGKIPRLGHQKGHLNWLSEELERAIQKQNPKKEEFIKKYTAYSKYLHKSILTAFQDARYKKSLKKNYSDAVIRTWRDGALSEYINFLRKNKLNDTADEWEFPLKMTKMGDEIWLYLRMNDGRIVQIFIELDKFNAFNEQYPADARDSFYHQLLDSIFELHRVINNYAVFSEEEAQRFAEQIETAILETPIEIPDDEVYRNGYEPESKSAEINWQKKGEIVKIQPVPALTRQKIRTGEKIPLQELTFHHTEKVFGGRQALYVPIKLDTEKRPIQWLRGKVVVFQRRIFTADGKEDVTDELLSDNYTLSPVLLPVGAAVTTDQRGLAKLNPYIMSNMNTYQKKVLRAEIKGPMDISEITAHRIVRILEKDGFEIKGDMVKKITGQIIRSSEERSRINFMELWNIVKSTGIEPERFFEIAADISRPVSALLMTETEIKLKGSYVMNAVLMAILEALNQEEEQKADINKSEEKLLDTLKTLAQKKGIDPNAVESIFDLFKRGMEMLIMDPGLDLGKIDESYFALIEQLDELTGISGSVIMNAFRKEFGIKADRTEGQTIEGSILWKEAQRLTKYNDEIRQGEEDYNLAEIDKRLWDSDFQGGKVADSDPNRRNLYLSALDVVYKDTKTILDALKPAIGQADDTAVPAGIVCHIESYITFHPHPDGTFSFSYKPGIEAVLRQMGEGIRIIFIAPDGKIDQAEKALKATGRFGRNIFIANSPAAAKTNLRDIKIENMVYLASDDNAAAEQKTNFDKIIAMAPDSAFHAVLTFAVLYARAGPKLINNRLNPEINTLVRNFLKLMDYKDEDIRNIISQIERDGFFRANFIRLKDTLREFQNRKIFIDVAA